MHAVTSLAWKILESSQFVICDILLKGCFSHDESYYLYLCYEAASNNNKHHG